MRKLLVKLKESTLSVLPIIALVLALNYSIAPLGGNSLTLFLISSAIMIMGITLFNFGVDMSLMPIGEHIGSALVKSRKLWMIILVTFIIGVFITMAEPDLIVFASQIKGVPDLAIFASISIGVGIALVIAFLRILFQVKLSYILMVLYICAFALSFLGGGSFISIAYEAGGVSTGPIMVPFVMALGLGLASVRGDMTGEENSFGLVALCLIGPILAVLILGQFYEPSGGSNISPTEVHSLLDIARLYISDIDTYLVQVGAAISPMLLLFALFQAAKLRLSRRALLKILVGTLYTYAGLVLFLTSANVGFMPTGFLMGRLAAEGLSPWVLVLIGMAMGYVVVAAEPAVFVLKEQVENITEGAISAKSMGLGLSIGVAVAVGLSMARVLTGLSLLYFVVPGYALALALSFIVPRLFTSVAFDSGAVASGPLAATFMLPFAMGASEALGGNVYTDAFGIVALVALMPVLVIQLFGVSYAYKISRAKKEAAVLPEGDAIVDYEDMEEMP